MHDIMILKNHSTYTTTTHNRYIIRIALTKLSIHQIKSRAPTINARLPHRSERPIPNFLFLQ